MKTKTELIELATAKNASSPDADPPAIALVAVGRDELLAALTDAASQRADELRSGAESSGKNSMLYVQREHLLEALAATNESA